MTPQERIKADALKAYPIPVKFSDQVACMERREGYIAGATAENSRAQVLVEDIQLMLDQFALNPELSWFEIAHRMKGIGIKALEQWKGGKEAAPTPCANSTGCIDWGACEKLNGCKEKAGGWQPIETAPKDGRTIEVSYDAEHKETCLACWSERPVCMLGSRNGGFPPGWATPVEAECDANLPLDPPLFWRQ